MVYRDDQQNQHTSTSRAFSESFGLTADERPPNVGTGDGTAVENRESAALVTYVATVQCLSAGIVVLAIVLLIVLTACGFGS